MGSFEAVLPPLYARWMSHLLPSAPPEEHKASCASCPMCNSSNRTTQDAYFNPSTRCCTYHPEIPNFLAGALLTDQSPGTAAGRAIFMSRLESPALLRPQGICPSLSESASDTLWNPGFGRDPAARCPYYLEAAGGRCGIWKHRTARCATWFCKHERGQVGRDFWRTLKQLLAAVEVRLSLWCIHKLEAGSPAFRELFPQTGAATLDLLQRQLAFLTRASLPAELLPRGERHQLQQEMWGAWLGRATEFYVASHVLVRNLAWEEVLAIGGDELARHCRSVLAMHLQLNHLQVPERVYCSDFRRASLGNGRVRVWGYSSYDPLDLPATVVDALGNFDGRSTGAVLATLEEGCRSGLEPEMLRMLCDFGLLLPAPPSAA